ncbi:hypothetical protein V8E54_014279 [Elaphomyces granulatus]
MNRAGGVAPPSRLPVEKRFHVCTMETLSRPSSPACPPADIAESSPRHLQFLGQSTPPFLLRLLFRGRTGVTSLLFRVNFVGIWNCRTMSCSHSTIFSETRTRLSNWRLEQNSRKKACAFAEPSRGNAGSNGIINGGREEQLLYKHWGASTSATLVVARVLW